MLFWKIGVTARGPRPIYPNSTSMCYHVVSHCQALARMRPLPRSTRLPPPDLVEFSSKNPPSTLNSVILIIVAAPPHLHVAPPHTTAHHCRTTIHNYNTTHLYFSSLLIAISLIEGSKNSLYCTSSAIELTAHQSPLEESKKSLVKPSITGTHKQILKLYLSIAWPSVGHP